MELPEVTDDMFTEMPEGGRAMLARLGAVVQAVQGTCG